MEKLKEFIITHKKISIIVVSILSVIVISYLIYVEIGNQNNINYAMHFIKDNYDYEQFNNTLIDLGNEKESIKQRAYNQFCDFIQEELNNVKNGNKNEKLEKMLKSIQKDDIDKCLRENTYSFRDKIENYYYLVKDYNYFCDIQQKIDNEEYASAFEDLEEFSKRNVDNEITKKSKSMQQNLEDKAIENVKQIANDTIKTDKKEYENYLSLEELKNNYKNKTLENAIEEIISKYDKDNKVIEQAVQEAKNEYNNKNFEKALDILLQFSPYHIKQIEEYREYIENQQSKIDYERYCYFNLIAVKTPNLTDSEAFEKVANRFNTTIESVIKSYDRVNSKGGWWYQDKYPDIFERYARQY